MQELTETNRKLYELLHGAGILPEGTIRFTLTAGVDEVPCVVAEYHVKDLDGVPRQKLFRAVIKSAAEAE